MGGGKNLYVTSFLVLIDRYITERIQAAHCSHSLQFFQNGMPFFPNSANSLANNNTTIFLFLFALTLTKYYMYRPPAKR